MAIAFYVVYISKLTGFFPANQSFLKSFKIALIGCKDHFLWTNGHLNKLIVNMILILILQLHYNQIVFHTKVIQTLLFNDVLRK